MTVEPPDFDPELQGHSAVEIQNTVHASVSWYEGNEKYNETECGAHEISDLFSGMDKYGPREEIANEENSLRRDCWPKAIPKTGDSE